MKLGEFIWADLSTYSTDKSINFYRSVFDWDISNYEGYWLSSKNGVSVGAIYETPEKFKKIGMPHFWMSYFKVDSIEETVAIARSQHGIVEIASAKFNKGNIALIRDPQGAGFTIYDDEDLILSRSKDSGTIVNIELHVSDVQKVIPFYNKLFNWDIQYSSDSDSYIIPNALNINRVTIKEYDNSLKGKYEYWVITILVESLNQTKDKIIKQGGSIISQESNRILMADNSGEAFFFIEERINSRQLEN